MRRLGGLAEQSLTIRGAQVLQIAECVMNGLDREAEVARERSGIYVLQVLTSDCGYDCTVDYGERVHVTWTPTLTDGLGHGGAGGGETR